MKFNTGNPVGSYDPRDLIDNSYTADNLLNGDKGSYKDRLGNSRKSWASVEAQAAQQQTAFNNFLNSSGFEYLGAYSAGIEFTEYNQYVVDGGEAWFISPGQSLPYTTTGAGVPEGGALMSRGEAVLRQEIGSGVVRADSLANLEATAGRFDGDAARLVSGTGRDGDFRWNASDLSGTLILSSVTSTSVDSGTDTITSAGHGLVDGDGVVTQAAFNGLSLNTVYWVVNATTDTFQLSATFGGAAFDLTGTTNFTVDHLLDPRKVIYVTAPDDLTGTGGVWVRSDKKRVTPEMADATGDGVADDAFAVQAIIDLTPSVAGEVELVSLYGVGSTGIVASGKSGLKIKARKGAGLKILSVSDKTITGFGATSLKIINCNDAIVAGIEVDGGGFANNGIGLEDCTNCYITYNKLYSCGNNGQIVSSGGVKNKYLFNDCRDSASSCRGMWIGNTSVAAIEDEAIISGNVCSDNGFTGIVATCINSTITGNITENNLGSGIIFSGFNGVRAFNIAVTGNVCNGNTFHGMQADVTYSTDADLAEAITIEGNVCKENLGSGLYAVSCKEWVIANNVCLDNNFDNTGSGYGIYIERAKGITVSGNRCFDSRTGASRTQIAGIQLVSTGGSSQSENVNISGNDCRNNTSDGIQVAANDLVTGLSISNNVCQSNSAYGIRVTESSPGNLTHCTVNGNICFDNPTKDLRVSPPNCAISSNSYETEDGVQFFTFTDLDTTPSVGGMRENYRANNSGSTTITDFDDGADGQEITVFFANANTTIQHGTILLKGGVNATPGTDTFMTFYRIAGTWREKSRSF